MRLLVVATTVVAAAVAGIVFLWPAPPTGPEPIAHGRDACAACRMLVSRPGFGGEMRDRDGKLTTYDDVGCLVRAILAAHRHVPGAWVEDHAGGGLVPLLSAHLVHTEATSTPMGSGLVAFADEAAALAFATAHAATVMRFEDVLRNGTLLARLTARPRIEGGERP